MPPPLGPSTATILPAGHRERHRRRSSDHRPRSRPRGRSPRSRRRPASGRSCAGLPAGRCRRVGRELPRREADREDQPAEHRDRRARAERRAGRRSGARRAPRRERSRRPSASSAPTLRAKSRAVAAGITRIALTSRAPTASSAAIAASATAQTRTRSPATIGSPVVPAASGSKPAAIQARRKRTAARPIARAQAARDDQLGRPDRQQGAEQELVDPGAGLEDVAGEDDPDRERGDEQQRRRGVGGDSGAAPEALEQEHGESAADAECGEGGRDPGRAGDDEPGEGRGADPVGEEGQPPQHDLCAEDPGERCQEDDLEGGPLHEGELEGLKHENHYLYREGDTPRTARSDDSRHPRPRPGSSTPRRSCGGRATAPARRAPP